MNLSDYGAMVYTQLLVGAITTAPTIMYIALCTEEPAPGDLASGLVEPVDATGYARQPIAAADWANVDTVTPVMTNVISYGWHPVDADWLPVTHVALCTDVTTNQIYCWTEITPFTATVGKSYTLGPNTLTMSVGGPNQDVIVV